VALENFNVFGMIFVAKGKTKITATAFSAKRPKSISNTFREANDKLVGLVLPFAARISAKNETPLLFGERAIRIDTEQVVNSKLYLEELKSLEARLSEFLKAFE
jgi:hypothetical protein